MSHLCKQNKRTLPVCTYGSSQHIEKQCRICHYRELVSIGCAIIALLTVGCGGGSGESAEPAFSAAISPTTYSAYSGTDAKPIPDAPALGPANSIIQDPTFGSRILRVTDAHTNGGDSLIPEYAGYWRTWNANSTALKLHGPFGTSYWLEFDASSFSVGDGSARPTLHPLNFDVKWEWSAIDPDIIYFLNGNQLAAYNKTTDVVANLGGPAQGIPVTHHVAVVGGDAWICSAAGSGSQNTYTQIYCVNPHDPSQSKFIDILKKTINGVRQSDPHWPTSTSGQTIGIHTLYGSAAGAWLGLVFVHHSWGADGDAVFNLETNTWSLLAAGKYSSGHSSIGGKFVNGSGSINGMYSGGACLRDPSNLMDTTQYSFIMQPPSTDTGWYDGEHSSWFNSSTNPQAPVLFSRYNTSSPPKPLLWYGEIIAAATDGSNTVWRFAHNHNGGLVGSYTGQSFAQISNDGRWALFSSPWDGTLGGAAGDFDYPTRMDTFIVELK